MCYSCSIIRYFLSMQFAGVSALKSRALHSSHKQRRKKKRHHSNESGYVKNDEFI